MLVLLLIWPGEYGDPIKVWEDAQGFKRVA